MNIRLVATYGVWYFTCLCLSADSKLGSETWVASRNIRICLHTGLHKLVARRALIRDQRRPYWFTTLTFSASDSAFFFKHIKRLHCFVAKEAWENGDISDRLTSKATWAFSTKFVSFLIDIEIVHLMTVFASFLFIRPLRMTNGTFRELSVFGVLPLRDFFTDNTEVRVLLGKLPLWVSI